MTPGRRPRTGRLRIAARWTAYDLRFARQHVLVNVVGGSPVLPRLARWLVYRAAGARLRTANVFPGLVIQDDAANLSVGERTFMNTGTFVDCAATVRIGDDCLVGPRVMLITSHHPRALDGGRRQSSEGLPVVIGDRVWIGAGAIVLPGVTIGDDVTIGAGAVVTRDCLDAGLYAGVPARHRRTAADRSA